MTSHLRAEHLVKRYRQQVVVRDVSLDVRQGEVVGLLGSNGAGKTTTFSIILGLIPHEDGRVYLDGEDITDLPMYLRAQKGLSLLPQEPSVFRNLTVEENLLAILETRPERSARSDGILLKTLQDFGLEKLAKMKAVMLSGGERRRLEVARAMITNPRFLLLDEPFTGIDPLAVQDLQRLIRSLRERGLGVLVTDHNVRETLKIVDRAFIIQNGALLMEGTPEEIVHSDEVRRAYLGDRFSL